MELKAVIEGLKALKKPCRVLVRTDSLVISAWIQNKIGKKTARDCPDIPEMVGEARALCKIHTVTFQWVRGHSGDPDNERCDQLCTEAIGPVSAVCMTRTGEKPNRASERPPHLA
jgi:ribonuclease HI